MQQYRSLVLDRNYVALSIVPWRKAIKLMVKGKAEALGNGEKTVDVPYAGGKYSVPSVIRLLSVIPWKAHIRHARFSRKGVISRDNNQCQYCGIKIGKNATIDHVIPVSRGGQSEYTNCVASCQECNNKKADMTLSEAGMKLKQRPKNPTFLTTYRAILENPPEEWKIYIMGASYEDRI